MENNQEFITLNEVKHIIEEQLATLVENSKHYRSPLAIVDMAQINQAICLSTQTLILLAEQNQSHGAAALGAVPYQPPLKEN